MHPPIPNLFRGKDAAKAQPTYDLFFAQLAIAGRHARIVEVCRQLRRFAAAAGNKDAALFTYWSEMHALDEIQDWKSCWRVLRSREAALYGRRLDLKTHDWKGKGHVVLSDYGPLLYFRGEYKFGCQLWENALHQAAFARKKWSLYNLWNIYRGNTAPARKYEVTLWHFHQALGKDWSDWPLWDRFIDGFETKLFTNSGISKKALRADPGLLQPFVAWILKTRDQRTFSGTSSGVTDLTESAERVYQRQSESVEKSRAFQLRMGPTAASWDEKLLKLFPELHDTPTLIDGFKTMSQTSERRREQAKTY